MSDEPNDLDELVKARAAAPRALGASPLATVTEAELRRYSATGNICGECRHFEPGHAQAEMARTRFLQVLVKEYGWKVEHALPGITAERSSEIGLCAEAGDTATTAFAPSCDHFSPARGKLKREARPEEQHLVVNDLRVAKAAQAQRFEEWKREQGLIPGVGPDDE